MHLALSANTIAMALFGGTGPMVDTGLIKITGGNHWMPSFYLVASAFIAGLFILGGQFWERLKHFFQWPVKRCQPPRRREENMVTNRYFSSETFAFLRELAENNNRQWFQQNKKRYEEHVKDPAIRFIIDFDPLLRKISRQFTADPRPVGGSLFRIYRDVRFSKDKSPYKNNTGIQLRHNQGKDVHAPGYYLHLETRNVFAGVGIWRPDSTTLGKIRDAIIEDPSGWKKAVEGKPFRSRFNLAGESLHRAPRGYDPDHPLIGDLKRKDFIGMTTLTHKAVTSPGFPKDFADICKEGTPFVKFLCNAIGLPF